MLNFLDQEEMSEPKFHIIGISDSRIPSLSSEAEDVVRNGRFFSGGKRHRELIKSHLPEGSEWIDVTVPLARVFDLYRDKEEIVVFASGDPLFFGYAATLKREFPESDIKVYPAFNSLQMLAHRMLLPYQDMVNVSLTGRPWSNLDPVLIGGAPLIGILTDRHKTPAEIARRLIEYNFDYEMTVGENLGNEDKERVTTLALSEAACREWDNPNCVILRLQHRARQLFGLPESDFYHLDGREKMITKMPVRLLTLAMLELDGRSSLWDVGFCTGSVSIEARRHYPSINITSFEIREEGRELMTRNSRKFSAPSITVVTGDFLELDLTGYPAPDAVFIGGHGGRIDEMLQRVFDLLLPGGVVVFNSVSASSCEAFRNSVERLGHKITETHTLTIDTHNPITIMQAR